MRFVMEEPCFHGFFVPHHKTGNYGDTTSDCPGGSRTVFEGLPDDMIERAVERAQAEWLAVTGEATYEDMMFVRRMIVPTLEAALGLGHDQ